MVDREVLFKVQERVANHGDRGNFNVISIIVDEDDIAKYCGKKQSGNEVNILTNYIVK